MEETEKPVLRKEMRVQVEGTGPKGQEVNKPRN